VPPQAAEVIRAALDPAPQHRPTVTALARVLEGGPPPTLLTPAGSIAASASVPPPHHTQVYQPAARVRKGTSPWLIAGIAVAVLAVALGLIAILGGIFGPATEDPAALGSGPTGNPTANQGQPVASSTPTAAVETVAALLQELNATVDRGIANGQVDEDKARDLRNRVRDLQRAAQSQKNNRGNQLAGEIRDFRSKLNDMAEDGEIAPELLAGIDAILVRLAAAANSSAR
jgi:polyhydroxyalkanoate synthesis regulator phasin